jgi:hypothetical protein
VKQLVSMHPGSLYARLGPAHWKVLTASLLGKHVWKLGIASTCGLAMAMVSPVAGADVLSLQAGTTTEVTSYQATCVNDLEQAPNEGPDGDHEAACYAANGVQGMGIDLGAGRPLSGHTVEATGLTQLIVQFQVDTQPGAPDASTLPVLIAVPVRWEGTLFNDNARPRIDVLERLDSFAEVNGKLWLAESVAGDPTQAGPPVASTRFMGAYHGGIAGCLSLPSHDEEVDAALMAAKCAVDLDNKEAGEATVFLSAMIQTGKVYDLVLELDGHVHTPYNQFVFPGGVLVTSHPSIHFRTNIFQAVGGDAFGLFWTAPGSITIGTDPQQYAQDAQNLQHQIARLRRQVWELYRELSERHDEDKEHHRR